MATPEEQLVTINKNLAAAMEAGDQVKIERLMASKQSVQQLVDINKGNFPTVDSATDPTAAKVTAASTPVTTNTAPEKTVASDLKTVKEADGSYTVVDSTKGVELYNSPNASGADKYVSSVAQGIDHQDAVASANTASANPNTTLSEPTPGDVGSSSRVVTPVQADGNAPSTEPATPTTEDPFEQARQEAANAESPTMSDEQTQALFASGDAPAAAVTDEQAAANRAALAQEDARDTAATAIVKPGQALDSANSITTIKDWRVKLSLAKGAKFLYGAATQADILYPLKLTDGVVFPYTPTIQTSYRASYDPTDLTHSNYRMYFYKNSFIDDIQITCDFTAQDSNEAAYLLAVIHFFKSATKMFYGNEQQAPSAGTPPPLVFISGYGQYQFNNHPMLISSFTYSLPNDVDYIRASTGSKLMFTTNGNTDTTKNAAYNPGLDFIATRLFGAKLNKGGVSDQPVFTIQASGEPTYVPTKIQLTIGCLPIVTRGDISKNFSLADYATGKLTKRPTGGIW